MIDRVDVIVFGATGFTGKYAVKNLYKLAQKEHLQWGIAGRSEEKLKAVLDDLKKQTGDEDINPRIIVADIKDEDSLKKMTAQAKVIVNCCGPYRFFGEPVVKACIETQTHHVDVSGEPQYMENMQLQYHKAAEERGVYIVSACGFDSIPADMGVVYLEKNFGGQLNSVETFITSEKPPSAGGASLHYGTWESAVYGLAHANELHGIRSQLFPQKLPDFNPKLKRRSLLCKVPEMNNMWALPFPGSDRAVIKRSQRHFFEVDKKRPIQIETYMALKSLFQVFVIAMVASVFAVLAKFKCGRYLLLKYPGIFSGGWASHEGPSEEASASTKFAVTLVGKGWNSKLGEPTDQYTEPPNKTMMARVSGTDPGYGATTTMLNWCALTILRHHDIMPGKGGVYPPGAAFAKTPLIEKLQNDGIKFEVLSTTP